MFFTATRVYKYLKLQSNTLEEEEEANSNDEEEQKRMLLQKKEEEEEIERQRKEFELREREWMEKAAKKAQQQQQQQDQEKKLLEENVIDDDWEYVEEGPAEIIWQGNEIIVKKKKVKVPKTKTNVEDVDRPTSNPLPPQTEVYASSYRNTSVSSQQVFESVSHQNPNFGTEQDKAHCPFHIKTGACRFGVRCSRAHFYPDKSCTLLIKNMYNGPGLTLEQDEGLECTDEEIDRGYEEFYEDVHTEFLKFGEIINFKACRNGSIHLRGNVYVHYKSLESAILACQTMNGRYFGGKQLVISPHLSIFQTSLLNKVTVFPFPYQRKHRPSSTISIFTHISLSSFHSVKVEGLPDGTETMADLSSEHLSPIQKAFDLTQDQVVILLSELMPDFIFYDFSYWIPPLAKPLGIKSIYMPTSSAIAAIMVAPLNFEGKGDLTKSPVPEAYPGSSSAKLRLFHMKDITYVLTEFEGMISLAKRVYTAFKNAEAICFRTCREIEGPFLDYLETQHRKPVLTYGLALAQPSNIHLDNRWDEWLASFEKGSVVYCAFGSECVLEKDQFQELVLGLEMTGLPFVVRLKPPSGSATLEEALPEGFKERVKGRGVVYGGWVQQTLMLSHPSVGCFVSHFGFGSLCESLVSTCQLVLVPHVGDQFATSSFLSKGLKVAVEVERREEDAWFSKESLCETEAGDG